MKKKGMLFILAIIFLVTLSSSCNKVNSPQSNIEYQTFTKNEISIYDIVNVDEIFIHDANSDYIVFEYSTEDIQEGMIMKPTASLCIYSIEKDEIIQEIQFEESDMNVTDAAIYNTKVYYIKSNTSFTTDYEIVCYDILSEESTSVKSLPLEGVSTSPNIEACLDGVYILFHSMQQEEYGVIFVDENNDTSNIYISEENSNLFDTSLFSVVDNKFCLFEEYHNEGFFYVNDGEGNAARYSLTDRIDNFALLNDGVLVSQEIGENNGIRYYLKYYSNLDGEHKLDEVGPLYRMESLGHSILAIDIYSVPYFITFDNEEIHISELSIIGNISSGDSIRFIKIDKDNFLVHISGLESKIYIVSYNES